jgi:NAD(P)-dependent dehydrogenase (short-subunit alcohol dehydrogenase family)
MPTPVPDRTPSSKPTASLPGPLRGRRALVTGGGRGLGAVISARLAHAGARVAITGRDQTKLAQWAAQLPNDPVTVPGDLASPDGPREVLARVVAELGGVDVLVNNAGAFHHGPSEELTSDTVDALLAVNTRGPLLLAAAVAAQMAQQGGGTIVNISSGLGEKGSSGGSLYASSKGALDASTRALAAEWGPSQVRVNGVRAGLLRSDASRFITENDHLRQRYEQTVPLRRLGENDEVADAVLFLVSPSSTYITGQILNVDGGSSTTAPAPTDLV